VRIGNAAARQLQLDIYGELMDSVYLYDDWQQPISSVQWEAITIRAAWLCDHWDQPDKGIWETRGGPRKFLYSQLMCWVAMERAIRLANRRGLPADLERWRHARDAIYRRTMDRDWSPALNAFAQFEGADVLDSAALMMPLAKFISPTDPRWLSTLDALTDSLVTDSLVYRYDPEASPDGLRGTEGTFSACSFWYVEALTRAGRLDEARLAFEKMLTYGNHLGLYAEQISLTGEQQGNFPPGPHPPRADQRSLQPRPRPGLSGQPHALPVSGRPVSPLAGCGLRHAGDLRFEHMSTGVENPGDGPCRIRISGSGGSHVRSARCPAR
jgi:GH15 family glucan-1,4-alpha-glucosidase